jgi:hypothetical protein
MDPDGVTYPRLLHIAFLENLDDRVILLLGTKFVLKRRLGCAVQLALGAMP